MNHLLKYLLIILISANFFNFWIIFDYISLNEEKISFLDVGQGDAELIQSLAGNILIDAGPDSKIVTALGKIFSFFDQKIDLFILSHPNKDHFNGLFDLLDRYQIRVIMLNNLSYNDLQYQKLLQEIKKRDILVIKGYQGVKVNFKKDNDLFIIYPQEIIFSNTDPNQFCLVALLNLGNNSFLFTGDISSKEEQKIIPFLKNNQKDFRVLKVTHHGSRYGTSEQFLNTFQPYYAVIEVGKNSYGHPHANALERLEQIGAKILRTDLEGSIYFKVKKNIK